MERVERIRKHPVFLSHMTAIEEMEQGRIYCLHGLEHSLDVARIMYIIALENGLSIEKDVIYGTALLHDIGRKQQYENDTPHHEAGANLAEQILGDCGYQPEEVAEMADAIRHHQRQKVESIASLNELLYVADKKSRLCYCCEARKQCYWEKEQKNQAICY